MAGYLIDNSYNSSHNNRMAEDLKYELLDLKKRSANLYAENQLLKIKVRKLESDNYKKNKQIESLIDPKKCENIRKIVSEHGAMMLLQLEEQCKKLQSDIIGKDSKIKKLETQVNRLKIYGTEHLKGLKNNKIGAKRSFSVNESYNSFSIKCRTISPFGSDNDYNPVEKSEEEKLKDNLEIIKRMKQSLKDNEPNVISIKSDGEEKSKCDTVKTLGNDGNIWISEVKTMKSDIKNLQEKIAGVVDDIATMKNIVNDVGDEQTNMKETLKKNCEQFGVVLDQFRELHIQDFLNNSTYKKSKSKSKRKKSRCWLTVKKDEMKYEDELKSIGNEYKTYFQHQINNDYVLDNPKPKDIQQMIKMEYDLDEFGNTNNQCGIRSIGCDIKKKYSIEHEIEIEKNFGNEFNKKYNEYDHGTDIYNTIKGNTINNIKTNKVETKTNSFETKNNFKPDITTNQTKIKNDTKTNIKNNCLETGRNADNINTEIRNRIRIESKRFNTQSRVKAKSFEYGTETKCTDTNLDAFDTKNRLLNHHSSLTNINFSDYSLNLIYLPRIIDSDDDDVQTG